MYRRGKSWVTDFWHNGERYRKSWGAISKTAAKEKEERFKVDVREGTYGRRGRKVRFETLAEQYLEHAREHKKPKSAKRNETSIRMLMAFFGGTLIDRIHPFMVEQYKKKRRDQGAAPATVNRDVACLRNMLEKAVEWGKLPKNQLKGKRGLLFREDNEKQWILSTQEEARLLEECDNRKQSKKYLKDLVLFALHSGMRSGEILNTKKKDVDVKNSYILVTDTKTHENRTVPMNKTLKQVIERRIRAEGSEYLFSNARSEKLQDLPKAWRGAVKAAGLIRWEKRKAVRFRFHDLRHTFGTRLGMNGFDPKTIMEIMGHRSHKTAMRYQHPAPDHKLRAVESLDGAPPKVPAAKIVDLKSEGSSDR